MNMNQQITAVFVVFALTLGFRLMAEDIKHIFAATDESGKQLIYVDQFNPENDWTVPLPGNRDIQLSGNNTVLVNIADGYREFDLKSGKMIKEIKVPMNVRSLIRLGNGHTILAGSNGIVELGKDDKQISFLEKPMGGCFRLLRQTKSGNYLYTSGPTTIREITPGGETVREIDLTTLTPETNKPYFMEEIADGNFLISTGYGATVLILDTDWKLIASYGGKGKVAEMSTHFFADAQQLANGNIVLAHWSGHKRTDSRKAPQAVEFDKDGNVVWTWHDPERAGTLHGIEIIR